MNTNEQRIAIAEHLGWTPRPGCKWVSGQTYGIPPKGENHHWQQFPDYPNDLNAMHEAEKVLRPGPLSADVQSWTRWEKYVAVLGDKLTGSEDVTHATAKQKAEAFLRTVGKWRD